MKHLRFVGLLAGSLLAGLSGVSHAAEKPKESAVQMIPFEVSAESVEFKGWRKASSDHFTVYSDAKPAEIDTVLRRFEMLHTMAQQYFRRRPIRRAPMIFVLPTSGSDWRKVESKSSVLWNVAISDPAHTLVDLVVTHYNWQESMMSVFAELGRAEMRWLNLPEPLWFQRGMMGFFAAARLQGDEVSLGYLSYKVGHLQAGFLPWDKVFRVGFKSPEYIRGENIGKLDGQCSVFLQYMLTNPEPVWLDRMMEWLSITESDTELLEQEFKRIFGQDWKTWEATTNAYLRGGGKYKVSGLRFPTGATEINPIHGSPPVREMRELFVLVQILNQHIPASTEALEKLLASGLKSESLRELLVEACISRNRPDAALVELRKLIDAGSQSAEVYALAADIVFKRQVPKITLESRITADVREARAWAARAVELEPRHVGANGLSAWMEALGSEVKPAQLEAVKQAYWRLHGATSTTEVSAALAVTAYRAGDLALARQVSQKLATSVYSHRESRAIANAVLEALGNP